MLGIIFTLSTMMQNVEHLALFHSLAVSLRFDGSVDRNQIDNEHVLAKIVNQKGEENLYFLGFEEPTSGAQKEH